MGVCGGEGKARSSDRGFEQRRTHCSRHHFQTGTAMHCALRCACSRSSTPFGVYGKKREEAGRKYKAQAQQSRQMQPADTLKRNARVRGRADKPCRLQVPFPEDTATHCQNTGQCDTKLAFMKLNLSGYVYSSSLYLPLPRARALAHALSARASVSVLYAASINSYQPTQPMPLLPPSIWKKETFLPPEKQQKRHRHSHALGPLLDYTLLFAAQ